MVTDVSFDIPSRKMVCLVGLPGCGNFTLARLIGGQIRPDSGQVTFNGQNIIGINQESWARCAQFVLSTDKEEILATYRTPLEFVSRSGSKRLDRQDLTGLKKVASALKIGLDDWPWNFDMQCQARLELLRSIVTKPEIIILGENAAKLSQGTLFDLIGNARAMLSSSFLIPTDDLGIALKHADIVAMMWAGRIMELGSSNDIESYAFVPFTRGWLSSLVVGTKESGRVSQWEELLVDGARRAIRGHVRGCSFHPVCPIAMDICIRKQPVLTKVQDQHYVACHAHS